MNKVYEASRTYNYKEFKNLISSWSRLLNDGQLVVLAIQKSANWAACLLAAIKSKSVIVLIDPNNKVRSEQARSLPWNIYITDKGIERQEGITNQLKAGYVIYSSGSTSTPKAIHVPYENLDCVIKSQTTQMGLVAPRVLWSLSQGFDASISDVLIPAMSGGELIIQDFPCSMLKRLKELLTQSKPSYTDLPPRIYSMLEPGEFPSITTALSGGEPPIMSAARKWKDIAYWSSYGPTEATISTSMCKVDEHWEKNYIGMPIDGVNYTIGDNQELLIEGHLAYGYLFNKKLTEEKFITHNGSRKYKTGDRVGKDINGYYFLGRLDNTRKRNGTFISAEEIASIGNEIGACMVKWEGDKLIFYCSGDISAFKVHIQSRLPRSYWPNHYIYAELIASDNAKTSIYKA